MENNNLPSKSLCCLCKVKPIRFFLENKNGVIPRSLLYFISGIILLGIIIGSAFAFWHQDTKVKVENGLCTFTTEYRDFVRSLRIHGIVEAVESYNVFAPRLSGGSGGALIVTKLISSGAEVKRGDLLVEFDQQNQMRNFLDRKAEYLDLLEQIKKKQAEQAAVHAQDDTELLEVENEVRKAILEVSINEIRARIEAEKNQQSLEEAEAKLKQLRATYDLKRQSAKAELEILEIRSMRASRAMQYAEQNCQKMVLRAPCEGIAVLSFIRKDYQIGEIQEGDQVWPGASLMQIVNPSKMQLRARVNQADYKFLHLGQVVRVCLDAYPGMYFLGKLEQIGLIGIPAPSPRVRNFTVVISIQGNDPKLMPDLSASVDLELERIPHKLVIPREALLLEGKKAFVKVKKENGVERKLVVLGVMNECEVVAESGITKGDVLLLNNN